MTGDQGARARAEADYAWGLAPLVADREGIVFAIRHCVQLEIAAALHGAAPTEDTEGPEEEPCDGESGPVRRSMEKTGNRAATRSDRPAPSASRSQGHVESAVSGLGATKTLSGAGVAPGQGSSSDTARPTMEEPVGWAVADNESDEPLRDRLFHDRHTKRLVAYSTREQAEDDCDEDSEAVVPLYLAPPAAPAEPATEKELKILRLKARLVDRLPFCPDHRDKVAGKPCRECEIERLSKPAPSTHPQGQPERRR